MQINHPEETCSVLSGNERDVCMTCSRPGHPLHPHCQNEVTFLMTWSTLRGFPCSTHLTDCTVSCSICLHLWLLALLTVCFLYAVTSHFPLTHSVLKKSQTITFAQTSPSTKFPPQCANTFVNFLSHSCPSLFHSTIIY